MHLTHTIVVIVKDVNDNPPVFAETLYEANVDEMSPIDKTVGTYQATDRDGTSIFYTLTSESPLFKLKSQTVPEILVSGLLNYDKVKTVRLTLEARDTQEISPPEGPSFTATTTIVITIIDIDNKPPGFRPCTPYEVGEIVVCQNTGYTGKIHLNEQETGALPLDPASLHAIDGDSGINEEITYSFLSGNEDGLFAINSNTGNITMQRKADTLGPIVLTVLATQKINTNQFATTTVTISVLVKSLHSPKFEKPLYEGLISSVGSMAMDRNNKDQPLRVSALDEDYAGTGGVNPNIKYSVQGNSDFEFFGDVLFLIKDQPDGMYSLEIVATDTSNDETGTSRLQVEVTSGFTTTSLPQSTTGFESTTKSTTKSTTSVEETTSEVKPTTVPIVSTTDTSATIVTASATSGVSTSRPVAPSGGFRSVDMAALGATLGVLLFLCLLVIGLLVYRMQKGKAAWKKIQEASLFRSSLAQSSSGQKEGIQYTNEAFQKDDDDRSSMGSGGPERRSITTSREPPVQLWNIPPKDEIQSTSSGLRNQLPDDTSDTSSNRADDEKEVKPILTKERKVEEGYKSVWFKEDIDPNAKEEVVIIPENADEESDEEDEKPNQRKSPKVLFADPDLDSGLGVKFDDPANDSESDNEFNIDL
ncbi:cadherin-related family member 5-like [Cyprinodon tularosa]|uniref:cadherin-related family member 5-like n=1 Tax=Cyprinodon tularosa TaxID=77115 RepID=UPI0018E251B1|nr:cadherin-related family member 5-like [Cyprinodon tularosa]